MRLAVSAAALDDLRRLHDFLVIRDTDSARRAVAVIDAAIQSIAGFPQRGRPSGLRGVRELVVPFGQAAYIIRYAHITSRDEIVILRLWHSREERE